MEARSMFESHFQNNGNSGTSNDLIEKSLALESP